MFGGGKIPPFGTPAGAGFMFDNYANSVCKYFEEWEKFGVLLLLLVSLDAKLEVLGNGTKDDLRGSLLYRNLRASKKMTLLNHKKLIWKSF